jgi:hypothetical protein
MKKRTCGNCGGSETIGIVGEVAPEFSSVYWCFTHHKSVRKNTKEKGCWTPRKRKEGA